MFDLHFMGDSGSKGARLAQGTQRSDSAAPWPSPHRSCKRLGVLQWMVLLSWSNV